ncbi:MAG TPA: lysophospholipid acyltransferase family protein, partial [Pirellulales bacterium]
TVFVVCYRLRSVRQERMPSEGAALVLCNHQSFYDPPLVGLAFHRQLNFLARENLLRGIWGRVLVLLNSIPVDREGMGFGGLKETLRRLQAGNMVLIFPEGERSRSGEVLPIKPGFSALAKRAGVPLIPMAIDGAFEVWPRGQPLPWPVGRIALYFGEPILPEEISQYDQRGLVAEVERRIRDCHAEARRLVRECR